MNNQIKCKLITGEAISVPADTLLFRPAVYALIYEAPKLLLVNIKSTGKWFFPGGAIEPGERIEDVLRREVREETGVLINHIEFFSFKESFFYYKTKAYHCFNFFYAAAIKSKTSQPITNDPIDEANRHEWVDITTLQLNEMQSFGGEILEKFHASLKT